MQVLFKHFTFVPFPSPRIPVAGSYRNPPESEDTLDKPAISQSNANQFKIKGKILYLKYLSP